MKKFFTKRDKRKPTKQASKQPVAPAGADPSEERPKEDIQEMALLDAFNNFDTNGDGVIDKDELSVLLVKHLKLKAPPSAEQIARILRKVDINLDGVINFEEFKIMMGYRQDDKARYLETFKTLDLDDDGFISREELAKGMRNVHPETSDTEIDHIMEIMDTNKDDKISFQEFINFFMV